MSLKKFVVDYIEGKNPNRWVGYLLFFFSKVFYLAIVIRNWAFDIRILPSKQFSKPIVSIGNIIAGGTGKTPLVLYLAKELSKTKKVAILSRGYLGELERAFPSVCINKLKEATSNVVGDEPFLYLTHLPQVDIWVGKNRLSSTKQAIENGAEVLLLDDGMQFRSLHRDVDIVVIDSKDPWGGNHYLPRGFLRDSPKRLKDADVLVLNHIENFEHYKEVEKEIRKISMAPITATHFIMKGDIPYKKAGVFCGIGKPQRFLHNLQKNGVEIVDTLLCVDHEIPTKQTLEIFAKGCQNKGAECLLCTEKDFVKIPQNLETCIPIVCVKIELEFLSGKNFLDTNIERLK